VIIGDKMRIQLAYNSNETDEIRALKQNLTAVLKGEGHEVYPLPSSETFSERDRRLNERDALLVLATDGEPDTILVNHVRVAFAKKKPIIYAVSREGSSGFHKLMLRNGGRTAHYVEHSELLAPLKEIFR
jgi:hypothetical protein